MHLNVDFLKVFKMSVGTDTYRNMQDQEEKYINWLNNWQLLQQSPPEPVAARWQVSGVPSGGWLHPRSARGPVWVSGVKRPAR